MPVLCIDKGPGFTSKLMEGYFAAHGIEHIFGKPYHPHGRGSTGRFNRRINNKLLTLESKEAVQFSPEICQPK